MRTILVTGSDTGVGKTHVVGELARTLGSHEDGIQIVKPVETGREPGETGDAELAAEAAGGSARAITLETFRDGLAPAAAAAVAARRISFDGLVAGVRALAACDWRIVEGAGGIASPIDDESQDWADFAKAIEADAVVIVVPDRVGAIGQARMAFAHAVKSGLKAGVWLNGVGAVDTAVHESNVAGLKAAGVRVLSGPGEVGRWAGRSVDQYDQPTDPPTHRPTDLRTHGPTDLPTHRAREFLARRETAGTRRRLRVSVDEPGVLNLADNDYLGLAHDPAVAAAVAVAAKDEGTSASASALITGWRGAHERIVTLLGGWHGFSCGLIWSSGYAANSAVLGTLPVRGDLVLADRLIHHSMIAGILASGARLQRYDHLRLDHLEEMLEKAAGRTVFVVTESVFSMDGDYPEIERMADLKRRYGFFWVVDEAHAVGWHGPEGAGLVRAARAQREVDVLVGTFGKALGSGGAYTLFNDEAIRDQLINAAGEFIYSTALPPTAIAAAEAAVRRVRELAHEQPRWHAASRDFRRLLQESGWAAADGESPIVPVIVGTAENATSLAAKLRAAGILAGAVRPPTVPSGMSRLRFSLKRSFTAADARRVVAALGTGGADR